MGERDRFLAEVSTRLTLPDGLRAEVLEELADHLDDATEGLIADGVDPSRARASAVRRLGSAETLARQLVLAHRPRSRLVFAAGAGALAVLRSGLIGLLVGWVLLLYAFVISQAAASGAASLMNLHAELSWTGGWNTVLTAIDLHVAAFVGGAAAVPAVARGGWRSQAEVRRPVSLFGGACVAVFILLLPAQPLNWASVALLSLVPLSFVAGTRGGSTTRFPGLRRTLLLLGIAVLTLGIATLARGIAAGSADVAYSYSTVDPRRLALVGPAWPTDGSEGGAFLTGNSRWISPGTVSLSVEAPTVASAARFHGLRLEAWRAEPPRNAWSLAPGQSSPFAIGPARRQGAQLMGELRVNTEPGADWVQVFLTGIAPDGRRYVLAESGPERAIFQGSVLDWYRALID